MPLIVVETLSNTPLYVIKENQQRGLVSPLQQHFHHRIKLVYNSSSNRVLPMPGSPTSIRFITVDVD